MPSRYTQLSPLHPLGYARRWLKLSALLSLLSIKAWQREHPDMSVTGGSMFSIEFEKPIPILRMFDEAKAREFYLEFLGFNVEFEHRFEPGMPLYLGISRNGLELHLSEHHGDASPGSTLFVPVHNIELFHAELTAKHYGYARPQIVQQDWGQVLEVHDPFGNRIRFCQR